MSERPDQSPADGSAPAPKSRGFAQTIGAWLGLDAEGQAKTQLDQLPNHLLRDIGLERRATDLNDPGVLRHL